MSSDRDHARVRSLRARAQHLSGRLRDAGELVRAIGAVQAQDSPAAALSIRVRTTGLTQSDVTRALDEDRSIVRIWAMRGTIHLVPAEDAGWLTDLLAPLQLTATNTRLTQLGVPENDRPRAVATICSALAEHGPLTRVELMEHLARIGIETAGQAAAHLPQLAALEGLVCFGPARRGKPTYALRDDWLGPDLPRLPRERAVEELARRHVRAYGPVTAEDFATWSGLPLRDARAAFGAIAGELLEVPRAGWIAADREPWLRARRPPAEHRRVRLLPAYDTYLLGYRTRELAVPAEHARRVAPGGGIIRPAVTVGGRAIGTWRQQRSGSRLTVTIEPFAGGGPIDAADEVADVGRFLGLDANVADA